jgi:hypothetical protein
VGRQMTEMLKGTLEGIVLAILSVRSCSQTLRATSSMSNMPDEDKKVGELQAFPHGTRRFLSWDELQCGNSSCWLTLEIRVR